MFLQAFQFSLLVESKTLTKNCCALYDSTNLKSFFGSVFRDKNIIQNVYNF